MPSCPVRSNPPRLGLALLALAVIHTTGLPVSAHDALTPAAHATTPAAGAPAPAARAARGDALRAAARHAEALAEYLGALQDNAGRDRTVDEHAYRMQVLTLADLGAAGRALDLLSRRPGLFATHERERLEGDRLAHMINRGHTHPEDPRQPLVETQQALDALQTVQRTDPRQTRWESNRLRVDTLSALNRLHRHQEVADGYHVLLEEGIEVPAYILATVGDSLLALRRPGDAAAVLEMAIAHAPDDFNARLLLAYAWMEQERFDLAMPMFEALPVGQEAWPRRAGARSGYANWDRYSGDVNLAMARSHAHDNATAERTLADLGTIGPLNSGLQSAIGSVQSRRMRPTAALERFDMALTLDPEQRDARAGRVDALMALDRVDEAGAAFAELRRRHPNDPRLDRIGETLAHQRGWQAGVEASRGRSNPRAGGTSQSPLGSRDGGVRLQLESPLFDDRWRIGAVAEEAWADFADQRVRFRRAGLGGRYRHDRLGVSAYALRAVDDYDHGGISLSITADWRFSDAWRGSLAYAGRDIGASLQARRFGITADSLTAAAVWTPSEETWLRMGASQLRYDDGNRREQLGVDASQRLLARPHWLVDGIAGASVSRGSLGGQTAYFNPGRDASASLGLRIENIGWRRYERHFRHRLELGAGPYWQRDHGQQWVPTAAYRHLWRFATGHVLEYGVAWSRPVYDGNREQRIGFDMAWHWGDGR